MMLHNKQFQNIGSYNKPAFPSQGWWGVCAMMALLQAWVGGLGCSHVFSFQISS